MKIGKNDIPYEDVLQAIRSGVYDAFAEMIPWPSSYGKSAYEELLESVRNGILDAMPCSEDIQFAIKHGIEASMESQNICSRCGNPIKKEPEFCEDCLYQGEKEKDT